MGKKSTAQPRPKVNIPPRGIGPVEEPNENDVLCGRGGRINAHQGNVQFREIVHARKKDYLAPTTKKLEKAHIAAKLVSDIREMNPSGRFLRQEAGGMWYDIGDAKAIKKVGQALREEAPAIRNEFEDDGGSSGDEGEKETKKAAAPSPAKAAQPAKIVTPSMKSPSQPRKKSPPRTKHSPRNVVSGRGPAHVQTHQHWTEPRTDVAGHAPDYTIGENYPAHHDHGIPGGAPMPSPMEQWERMATQQAHPFVSGRFEQPLGMRPSRGFDALDLTSSNNLRMGEYGCVSKSNTNLTSSSDPTNGPTEQIAFGRTFNTTLVSSGSTNFSSISGLSADERKLRLSSGSSEERTLQQYQAATSGTAAAIRKQQREGRAAVDRAVSGGYATHGGDPYSIGAGRPHPHLQHSVSLGSSEAAAGNSLRSSHLDADLKSRNLSQVDEAMEFENLRGSIPNTEMEQSLRLSQLALSGGQSIHPGTMSGASDLTFSLMSVENGLLPGSRSFDGLLDSGRGNVAAMTATEKEVEQMHDSWGTNGMPTPLGEAGIMLSTNSRSTGDSRGLTSTETSSKHLKEDVPPPMPLPAAIRPRIESTSNASALTNMSMGTQGSHRSSTSRYSNRSDFSRGSTMSDLSTELTALDLAWGHEQDDISRRRMS